MPSIDDELGGLSSDQRRDLRDYASQLKKLLLSGADFVDLRRFLPPPEAPHRRAVLHELIKAELEVRYARGQGRQLEEFLGQYPELGGSQDLPAGLLYEEYRVRSMFGDNPTPEEYRARFPLQFEQFQRLVHRHAPPESSPEARPPNAALTLGPSLTFPADVRMPPTQTNATPTVPPAPKPSGLSLSQPLTGMEGYQLLERIGRGAYGDVYRALAPGGVVVAIKRIFRSMDDESSQRELKALERIRELRHPFLLQTHSFRAFDDRLLIVMELADGSLEDRLKECRKAGLPGIPADELLRYFSEAAEALDFLHQQKISHRDIKPQNLLHLKGHAKVADFGIARPQQNALDHTLNVGGTPPYMPPEMWRGDISVHSDQYSFALTWYEMRTGRRVFSATNQLELLQQHSMGKPDVSGVSPAEQKVLLRALAKQPDQRFPTCVAFVQALAGTLVPSRVDIPARGKRFRVAFRSLAIGVTALLIALAITFWRQPQPAARPPENPPSVSWRPSGWEPEDANVVKDRSERLYFQQLVHYVPGVGGQPQKIVIVAVPQTVPSDPPTFYAMKNKVWNDLYAAFMADPESKRLFKKYSSRSGCQELVHDERAWRQGGYAEGKKSFGVEGEKGKLPVFRVTVTEAHCFAEWLGGLLPTRQQWRKAAGWDEDERTGPFDGDPHDTTGLALGLKEGPRPVEWGDRDISIYGCRQMASNGYEWTRTLADEAPDGKSIPLLHMTAPRYVVYEGQTYLSSEPLTFQAMASKPNSISCKEARSDISFRIVLEQ